MDTTMGDEEHAAIENRLSTVESTVEKMDSKLDTIAENVVKLMTLSEHAAEYCPMRVDIARASNGATQAKARAEKAVTLAEKSMDLAVENRVGIARLVATAAAGGGSIGGLIGAAVAFALSTM